MSDPDSPEARAELEVDEVRFWISVAETGLWCPTCALPSGYRFVFQRDPAERPTDTGLLSCANDKTHRIEEDA